MLHNEMTRRARRAGTTTVELALAAPLLFLIMVGAADFARVFIYSVVAAGGSATGAFFGSQSNTNAAAFNGVESNTYDAIHELSGATITPELYCDCPNGLGGSEVDCIEGTCPGYGSPRVYSKATVTSEYEAILAWPGIPNPVTVSRTTLVRVQ